jgi:hypothetical protein
MTYMSWSTKGDKITLRLIYSLSHLTKCPDWRRKPGCGRGASGKHRVNVLIVAPIAVITFITTATAHMTSVPPRDDNK